MLLTQAQAKNTAPATEQTKTETKEEALQRLLLSSKARVVAKIFKANNNPQLEKDTKKAVIKSCAPIIARESSPATGLALLTAFYVYSLFSNNLPIVTEEPGPKSNLGIMSRISFSEMFQKLPPAEKELYQTLITECLAEFFQNKLVSYKSAGDERISFQQWFESIINNPKDLLSPPPGCRDLNPTYAMGAYDDFTDGHALLEVRSYSERALDGEKKVTIDNFCQFIDNEARWFFNLQQNYGENDEV